MKTNAAVVAVVLACLAGGAARAADVVILRGETDREFFDRTGMVRAVDARSAAGWVEFNRLTRGAQPLTKAEEAGGRAGAEAVQHAGRHVAHLTDADIMRRARAACAKAGYKAADAEQFTGKFVAAFTTARMNARQAAR